MNLILLLLIHCQNFEIRESIDGNKTTPILPDLSTCSDCLKEIFDPHNSALPRTGNFKKAKKK